MRMISFLFWNLMGNQTTTWVARSVALRTHIGRIVSNFSVDVLLLAESAFNPSEVIGAINGGGGSVAFCYPPSNSPRIHLFDQVLLRPALMDTLAELRILEDDGQISLLTDR